MEGDGEEDQPHNFGDNDVSVNFGVADPYAAMGPGEGEEENEHKFDDEEEKQ